MARAAVEVSVQDSNGVAAINYTCTAGEVVRSFALDVRVEPGQILGIADFFRGVSRAGSRGYGIYPAALRDHITVSYGTNANWDAAGYTPLAVVADRPGDTLAGLGSPGVTLEFGGLWDPMSPASVPPSSGTLCTLRLSGPAQVTVAPNASRGGIVAAQEGVSLNAEFAGAFVDPTPRITDIRLEQGLLTIRFRGGELEAAPSVTGPWSGTGDTSGTYTNIIAPDPAVFYRVRGF